MDVHGPQPALQELLRHPGQDSALDAVFAEPNEWAISRPLAEFLFSVVTEQKRRSILEFGAGRSSLVLATALDRIGGGRLTSVEHEPEYGRDAWASVQRLASVDAVLCEASLVVRATRHGVLWTYRGVASRIGSRGPFDLVVIDAPPGRYGRDAPLYDAFPFLAPGALIVLDDAARPAERTAVRRWLETFPGLCIAASDMAHGRGTVALAFSGDRRRRVVPRAILGTVHDRLTSVKNRLRYRR